MHKLTVSLLLRPMENISEIENKLFEERKWRILLRNAAIACQSAHMTDFGPANEWHRLDVARKASRTLSNDIVYASLEEAANWKV